MGDRTKVEWCDATWSPITGCSPISEGCEHCYAARMARRLRGRCGYPEDDPFRVTFHPERLDVPLRWKKPRRIFVCSMGDLFHEDVETAWIERVLTVAALCPQHTFMLLTKRPERMRREIAGACATAWRGCLLSWAEADHGRHPKGVTWPLPNVWLGVTVENQARADERIPLLLQTPAAKRFVSCEPLLGPLDLFPYLTPAPPDCGWPNGHPGLDWCIAGGETGPGARPMHPAWTCSLRDQCQAAEVPFFFKHHGEWCLSSQKGDGPPVKRYGVLSPKGEWYDTHTGWNGRDLDPETGEAYMVRVGKKRAGAHLDGREWREVPQ